MKKLKSVYTRYIISFAAILCIPLIFFFIMYSIFISNLRTETQNLHQYKSEQTVTNLENYFKSVISESHAMDASSADVTAGSDDFDKYSVQKKLRSIMNSDSMIYNAGLYYKNRNTIITTSSEYGPVDFYNMFARSKISSYSDYVGLINNVSKTSVSNLLTNPSDNSGLITIFFRYPSQTSVASGTLFFMISKANLDSLISNVFYGYGGSNVLIAGADGSILYSLYDNSLRDSDYIKSKEWKNVPSYGITQKINSSEYMISSSTSNYLNLNYIILTPTETILSGVRHMRMIILLIFLLVFVLGGALIYVLVNLNYNPLKNIYNKFRSSDSTSENEIEVINKGVSELLERENDLKKQVEKSHSLAWSVLLLKLLKSEMDTKTFVSESRQFENEIHGNYFAVIIVNIYNEYFIDYDRDEFGRELIKNFNECFYGTYVDVYEDTSFVFLVNSENPNVSAFERNLVRLRQKTEMSTELAFSISSGGYCDSLKLIKNSYGQAMETLGYIYVTGFNSVILYNDISRRNQNEEVDVSKETERLKTGLQSHNIEGIKQSVVGITEIIKGSNATLKNIRSAVAEVAGAVAKEVYESRYNYTFEDSKSEDLLNLSNQILDSLISATTIDEFGFLIINVGQDFCSNADDSAPNDLMERKSKMLEYVDKNVYDANFSIKQMADEFGMVQSQLSQQFSLFVGQTIISYVNQKRIQKAKDMLINSDILIKDLILEIGFYDASSFIRKFKQNVGITPKKYREKYGKVHSDEDGDSTDDIAEDE